MRDKLKNKKTFGLSAKIYLNTIEILRGFNYQKYIILYNKI